MEEWYGQEKLKRHTLEVLELKGHVLQRRHGVEAHLYVPLEAVPGEHLLLDERPRRERVAAHRLQERARLLARELQHGAQVAQARGRVRRPDAREQEEVEDRLGVLVRDRQRVLRVAEPDLWRERPRVRHFGVAAQYGKVRHFVREVCMWVEGSGLSS